MSEITLIGIDLAKSIFRIHAQDATGRCVFNKNVKRENLVTFLVQTPACAVVMEACGSSHYWARKIESLGHVVHLIHPKFVMPYRLGDKNDANDAAAICAAFLRPNMRFVKIRTREQSDMQGLHRIREGLVSQQTEMCNRIRGLLAENGIVLKHGAANVFSLLPVILADLSNEVSPLMRRLLQLEYDHLVSIRDRLKQIETELKNMVKADVRCRTLMTVPGVGLITATLICSELGNGSAYRNGRSFAAYLGLVPRQHSSGGKNMLYGITKRGNRYIRTLLIHGARTVIQWLIMGKSCIKGSRLAEWVERLIVTRGKNKATVALASKLARICWAMTTKETKFNLELSSSN